MSTGFSHNLKRAVEEARSTYSRHFLSASRFNRPDNPLDIQKDVFNSWRNKIEYYNEWSNGIPRLPIFQAMCIIVVVWFGLPNIPITVVTHRDPSGGVAECFEAIIVIAALFFIQKYILAICVMTQSSLVRSLVFINKKLFGAGMALVCIAVLQISVSLPIKVAVYQMLFMGVDDSATFNELIREDCYRKEAPACLGVFSLPQDPTRSTCINSPNIGCIRDSTVFEDLLERQLTCSDGLSAVNCRLGPMFILYGIGFLVLALIITYRLSSMRAFISTISIVSVAFLTFRMTVRKSANTPTTVNSLWSVVNEYHEFEAGSGRAFSMMSSAWLSSSILSSHIILSTSLCFVASLMLPPTLSSRLLFILMLPSLFNLLSRAGIIISTKSQFASINDTMLYITEYMKGLYDLSPWASQSHNPIVGTIMEQSLGMATGVYRSNSAGNPYMGVATLTVIFACVTMVQTLLVIKHLSDTLYMLFPKKKTVLRNNSSFFTEEMYSVDTQYIDRDEDEVDKIPRFDKRKLIIHMIVGLLIATVGGLFLTLYIFSGNFVTFEKAVLLSFEGFAFSANVIFWGITIYIAWGTYKYPFFSHRLFHWPSILSLIQNAFFMAYAILIMAFPVVTNSIMGRHAMKLIIIGCVNPLVVIVIYIYQRSCKKSRELHELVERSSIALSFDIFRAYGRSIDGTSIGSRNSFPLIEVLIFKYYALPQMTFLATTTVAYKCMEAVWYIRNNSIYLGVTSIAAFLLFPLLAYAIYVVPEISKLESPEIANNLFFFPISFSMFENTLQWNNTLKKKTLWEQIRSYLSLKIPDEVEDDENYLIDRMAMMKQCNYHGHIKLQ